MSVFSTVWGLMAGLLGFVSHVRNGLHLHCRSSLPTVEAPVNLSIPKSEGIKCTCQENIIINLGHYILK